MDGRYSRIWKTRRNGAVRGTRAVQLVAGCRQYLSVAGVVLSMAAIFVFLVGEGFGRLDAVTCCLALAATEPFVAMANQSKYDYITFLLAVCGLLLAARRHLFLAGLISVLAIEVQPIGIMAPIYLVAYELSRMIQVRRSASNSTASARWCSAACSV